MDVPEQAYLYHALGSLGQRRTIQRGGVQRCQEDFGWCFELTTFRLTP